MRFTRIILFFCILVVAITVYFRFAHHKVIYEGEFLGLVIGDTKDIVLSKLIDFEHVTHVRGKPKEYISISANNIDELQMIRNLDAFVIAGPLTQITVIAADGIIVEINQVGIGWQMDGEWESVDQLLPSIQGFLMEDPSRGVFNIVKGYGIGFRSHEVQLAQLKSADRISQYRWLLAQDRWFFDGEEAWTFVDLFFSGNFLERIEFTDNFMELP